MTLSQYAPTSLEHQAQAIGQRYSKTSREREQIAEDIHALLTAYEQQGGRYSLQWIKKHAGLSHGMAVSMRDAGYALAHKAARGQGVTALATIGRQLRAGKSLVEAQHIATDQQARQEAAQEAHIGVGKVTYPTALTGEIANTYAALATSLSDAGLPQQDVPEMTVTLARLAMQNMTPQNLHRVESGGVQQGRAAVQHVGSDFYSWLARQPCACCSDAPPVELHHLHVPMTADNAQGRRHKDKSLELLLPLCLRHHQGARYAAHAMSQDVWSQQWFGSGHGALLRAAQYLSEWAQETGVLRGER